MLFQTSILKYKEASNTDLTVLSFLISLTAGTDFLFADPCEPIKLSVHVVTIETRRTNSLFTARLLHGFTPAELPVFSLCVLYLFQAGYSRLTAANRFLLLIIFL